MCPVNDQHWFHYKTAGQCCNTYPLIERSATRELVKKSTVADTVDFRN